MTAPSKTRRIRWEVLPMTAAERKTHPGMLWKVTRDSNPMGAYTTKAAAIEFASTTARLSWKTTGQLATLKIKGLDGKVQEERTYGRDPSRTTG